MGARRELLGLSALAGAARLSEDLELAEELTGRFPPPGERRPVGVSEILVPRRAFWRRLHGPAPLPLEREARLEQGRAWHRRLGDAVASEGRLEVRFRRGGLSARIDLLADVPVEIKTTLPMASGSPATDWPDQIEQLAVYCALAERKSGRLVHLATPENGPPVVSISELGFRDLSAVLAEVRRRESQLRSALEVGTPRSLERCRWFDVGCEFRTEGICDCRGDEVMGPSSIVEQLERRASRTDIAERWTEALTSRSEPTVAGPGRFRDLLYPRRAYFDRTAGRPALAVPARPAVAPLDLYERTVASLELGPVGDLHRLTSGPGAPGEEVLAWRESPCLVRSSRVRSRLTASEIGLRFPQYVVDLGFRCGLTGTSHGTLIVGHDAPAQDEPSLQVFRLDLPSGPEPFARAWEDRRAAFDAAIAEQAPQRLPSCPGWMTADCAYRAACGCAGEAGRSQR